MTSDKVLERRLEHAKRMLVRAEKRQRQTAKLVEKWKHAIVELERAGITEQQTKLFPEERTSERS